MATFFRFLVLVVILNVVRYLVGGLVEQPFILPHLFGEMEANPSYFATEFTTIDWATSFFYNFMMWLAVVWVYHSVSFIYMNHYSHPKAFYFWNVLNGAADAQTAPGS